MVEVYEPEWLDRLVAGALPDDGFSTWVPTGDFETSPLVRVPRYPSGIEAAEDGPLTLEAVRNEQQSGQVAVAADVGLTDLTVTVDDLTADSGAEIAAEHVRIRFAEYVPVVKSSAEHRWATAVDEAAGEGVSGSRAPDLVADPLVDAESVDVPALRAQPVWFTVSVPESAAPGTYAGAVHVDCEEFDRVTYDLELTVHDVTLPDPTDYEFHFDMWIQPNAIAAEHDVEPWSEAHWTLLETYLADLASRSQSMILTTIIDEPWQQSATRYDSMVTWHHDDGEWSFDYTIFDRFVETALACGVGPEIAAYSLLTFSAPERITYIEDGERVVEETEAGSDRWVECWTTFLEDFTGHLRERGWDDQTVIAIDERDEAAMNAVHEVLEAEAPELADRIQLAGRVEAAEGTYDFSTNTSDMPLDPEFVARRRAEGQRTTFYTGGRPAHPNTFSFSPPIETQMLPWIAAEADLDGYLQWAYNNWPHDPRENPSHGYPQGGEYLVYPGEAGPDSSIRWELFREGIEDAELAGMLRERDPDSNTLAVALDIATRDVDGREKDPADVPRARSLVVEALAELQ